MRFAALEGKRVAVWGAGREGRAALAALARRLPDLPVTLFCRPEEARVLEAGTGDRDPATGRSNGRPGGSPWQARLTIDAGEPDANVLAGFDVVIKSPGISAYKLDILAAQRQGTVFTSGTALWFGENPDARVIGVTGSKGKSTTAAMIAHLARSIDVTTALAGNIGLPLLELDGQSADLWVVELSSFQTGDAGSLNVGVVTSLFPEHLDWHGSAERYFADKLKLAEVSRSVLVNAGQPELLARTAIHPRRLVFGDADGWHVDAEGWIARGTERVLDGRELSLSGVHNRLNACAALAALEQAGFDAVAAATSLADFRPLPHRLQTLGQRNGITWIDDSISTTPQATLAAIDSIDQRPLAVIVGGYDRGLDWGGFAAAVARHEQVTLVMQGDNSPRIAAALADHGVSGAVSCADLTLAVAQAQALIGSDGCVALSPGAPSFDQFRDYAERGCRFAELAGFSPDKVSRIVGLGIA
ncbi:MAG: UDP-N-acetylmuramoyl-L-alanine--D-glutamate ligase [Rhodanobacteraceae bacterium]